MTHARTLPPFCRSPLMSQNENGSYRDPRLLGVQILYCDGSGKKPKSVWVDLDAVGGIAWSTDATSTPPLQDAGTKKLPKYPKGPDDCPKATGEMGGGTSMCWWNGTDWECGDAEE